MKPTKEIVEQWLNVVNGEFYYKNICDGAFKDSEYNAHLRMILLRLKNEGKVEPVGSKDGNWRVVQNSAKPINWKGYSAKSDSGLLLPFDLRKWVFIYPDTTVVVAGSKSSGKTGFLYRTVVMNMNGERKVKLLTNLEGGIGMLQARFNAMDVEIPDPPPFDTIPVYENYHDYIKEPNMIYVIDYIDCPDGESFYKIAHLVSKIDHKLHGLNSNAVIGLQKPYGRDWAFGGEQTLKVATLAIAMDKSKLKIVDAKVSADKKVHPKNMQWTFQYQDEGTKFINIQQSYES